jgi:hypothetical protein
MVVENVLWHLDAVNNHPFFDSATGQPCLRVQLKLSIVARITLVHKAQRVGGGKTHLVVLRTPEIQPESPDLLPHRVEFRSFERCHRLISKASPCQQSSPTLISRQSNIACEELCYLQHACSGPCGIDEEG